MEIATGAALSEALRDLLLSGGKHGGERRVPTAARLDDIVIERVQKTLDELAPERHGDVDRQISWAVLVRAVRADDVAPVEDRKLLVAASHLLARGRDPRDPSRDAPYDDRRELLRSIGSNDSKLYAAANVGNRARYETSITFRRYFAAVASKLGDTVDTLRPDKQLQARYLGGAVLRAVERTLADVTAMRLLIDEHAPPADEAGAAQATNAQSRRLRMRRGLVWSAIGGVAVAAVAVVIGVLGASAGTNQGGALETAPEAVAEVRSVAGEPPKWDMSTRFWVPVTAPLEELDDLAGGCDNPTAREWLLEHGHYRHSHLFTVRSLSDGAIGITNVTAQGETSPPEPGIFVSCSDGGAGGGELEWSSLALELADGAVATFTDKSRASDFFWRDIEPGKLAGVQLFLSGEQDFKGTLTVEVSPADEDASELPIPAIGSDEPIAIDWRALPEDKIARLILERSSQSMRCLVNAASVEPCNSDSIRAAVLELWDE